MRYVLTFVLVLVAAILRQGEAFAFGANFNPGRENQRGTAFEADVMIEAPRLEQPLRSGLYLAWQSEMESTLPGLPAIGGHWGFQMFPGAAGNGYKPIFTFNFGWMFTNAIITTESKALVRSMRTWNQRFWINNSARMRADILQSIADSPRNPNLFMANVGQQRGLPGTQWSDPLYHVVDWQLGVWYRVRLARDTESTRTNGWVLRKRPDGTYFLSERAEPVQVYAWRVTLVPEKENPDGTFAVSGTSIEMAPFFLDYRYDRMHTFNCWGEALGGTPKYPLRWWQVKPRVLTLQNDLQDIRRVDVRFWGYDQPDDDAGPRGDSRKTHAFYIGYCGRPSIGGRAFPLMNRGMREGGLFWDDDATSPISIELTHVPVEWREEEIAEYFANMPGAKYRAEKVQLENADLRVNRSLILPAQRRIYIEYGKLFGAGGTGLEFDALTSDAKLLRKDAKGFSLQGIAGDAPFHIEIEAAAANKSNTVGWIDLLVRFANAAK